MRAYPPLINIDTGQDITIRELAERIAQVVGYPGRIEFDSAKPDGTPRKLLDITRLAHFGWGAERQTPSVALMPTIAGQTSGEATPWHRDG